MQEHYVTAMVMYERAVVMSCRCGEIVKADLSRVNGTFSMHIAEATEAEAKAEAAKPESQQAQTLQEVAKMFGLTYDPTKTFPNHFGVSK